MTAFGSDTFGTMVHFSMATALLLLGRCAAFAPGAPVGNVTCSPLMLVGIDGSVTLTLPPYLNGTALPAVLQYEILAGGSSSSSSSSSATEAAAAGTPPTNFSTVDGGGDAITTHTFVLPAAQERVPGAGGGSGTRTYRLRLRDGAGGLWPDVGGAGEEPAPMVFSTFFLPGWTSLLPPLVTLGVSIATRQVRNLQLYS